MFSFWNFVPTTEYSYSLHSVESVPSVAFTVTTSFVCPLSNHWQTGAGRGGERGRAFPWVLRIRATWLTKSAFSLAERAIKTDTHRSQPGRGGPRPDIKGLVMWIVTSLLKEKKKNLSFDSEWKTFYRLRFCKDERLVKSLSDRGGLVRTNPA